MVSTYRTRTSTRTAKIVTAFAVIALAVSGCSSSSSSPAPTTDTTTDTTTEPAPETTQHRIAALSYDVAETVAALGHASELILVPASAKNVAMTNYADELEQVPNELATEADLDPETILSVAPDLVLHTPRQRGDSAGANTLSDLDVPVLSITNTWSTLDEVLANIDTIGEALDAQDAATQLIDTITSGLNQVSPKASGIEVLLLSNQQQAFAVGSGAFPSYLVELTGASLSSTKLGIEQTRPIDAELVVRANPDAIILIDMHGTNRAAFDPILTNPAVASLDVMKDKRILVLQGRQIQALALAELPVTAQLINDWLATFTD